MNHPAILLLGEVGNKVEILAESTMGAVFILASQAAIAGHIGIEDGR